MGNRTAMADARSLRPSQSGHITVRVWGDGRPRSTAPRPPSAPSADLALLERLTRHAEVAISEAEWFTAACRAPARGTSVEDEVASLRALAKKAPAHHAAIRVRARAHR